jgi:hypothetical protein
MDFPASRQAVRGGRNRQGIFQLFLDSIQPATFSSGLGFIAIQMSVGDQQQAPEGMIEYDQHIRQQEDTFWWWACGCRQRRLK